MKMEKTTVVVVLVIGVMSSKYWAMEARVREIEKVTVRVEAQVRVVFIFYFLFYFITSQVWIISIPYLNYLGNIHTLPD